MKAGLGPMKEASIEVVNSEIRRINQPTASTAISINNVLISASKKILFGRLKDVIIFSDV